MDQTVNTDERAKELLAERLDAFGNSLAKKRQSAINGRKESGIEDEWVLAEESYQGIDDANRGTVAGKPSGPNGGYINGPVQKDVRSRVFLNITRPYVDAAAAKVGDMLLPTDDTPWAIKPTPLPELEAAQKLPGIAPAPTPVEPQVGPDGQPMPPEAPQKHPLAEAAEKVIEDAKKKAEGATKQIEDWLVESRWHGRVREMIEDCARLGTGVIKGPVPVKRTSRVAKRIEGGMAMMIAESISPESKSVDPWNFYPDPACGESIHEGSFVWEKDMITGKGVRDLIGLPGYIESQIKKVLEQGPQAKHNTDGLNLGNIKAKDDDQFEIWYYHGNADKDDLIAAGVEVPDDENVSVPCRVTMINDVAIHASLSALESGEFPYDVMVWQRKPGVPWGTGVAIQINTPQRMINAGSRNMMDNAGYSAGPQLVISRDSIEPSDGKWTIAPRKTWWLKAGADVNSVANAFMAINIPSMQKELMEIIQFALKMAEDVTGLPMLMQGQQGSAPDTVGGMQIMNNNASVVLRRIARLFDDRVTRPHITRYYEWLMMYGEDDSIKGDFQIEVRGSTALVERDIQNQAVLQMAQIVANPSFGIDPEKWIGEYLKSLRLDPKRFIFDEEKKAEMANQPPPPAPQIEVAKIRQETDLQKTQMLLEAKAQETQTDAELRAQELRAEFDRDTAYVQAENQRTSIEHEGRMRELEMRYQLAMLEYANKKELKLEDVKASLAKEAMKLNSVNQLAQMGAPASKMPTPPIEPKGLAQPGKSYQQ